MLIFGRSPQIRLPHGLTSRSPRFKAVIEEIRQVAQTNTAVLLLGETGSGKEVLAQAVHDASARKDRAMVKVNCAALPATLIESELFSREKGAFTGAIARQPGRFEVADGSTIVLDEIGELPLELQPKLLRVLQDGEFERLGGSRTIKVDVRVIAATNRDLAQAVSEGKFREDLFYRLDVFPIELPPLRERREDIPFLSWTFVKEFSNSIFEALLRQLSQRTTHQRSVLASVSRAGAWWNFDIYYAIGSGSAEDANLRSREATDRIRIAIKNLATDGKYTSCRSFLLALGESVEGWFEDFLTAARTISAEVCRPVLSEAGDLWARCEADYRPGFKARVSEHLKKWFEEQSPRSMHVAIEEGLQRAWTQHVIRPLEQALGTAVSRNDVFDEL